MIAKKICMVGAFAVGKTSLVRRYVQSIYSDEYKTTIGVKISKKQVHVEDTPVQLMVWDIEGVDIFTELKPGFIRGASGLLLVIDGTRPRSYENIGELVALVRGEIGPVPIVLLANKCDLSYDWKLDDELLTVLSNQGMEALLTSAKTGENVEYGFELLVSKILSADAQEESL